MNPVVVRTLMILACVVLAGVAAYFFLRLPIGTQQKKIKEWLLYAVIMAEKELGGGTGQIKLRYVYDMFTSQFKFVATLIPFTTFSNWVDEALEKMRSLLETNVNVNTFIYESNRLEPCIGFMMSEETNEGDSTDE